MYNLIEYSKNYSKTTGSLWNYYRDESKSAAQGNINYSIKGSKPFDYKTRITGRLEGNDTEKEVEIVVRLKHLSNSWRTLDIPIITSEINLILTWSKSCVITSKPTRDVDPETDPAISAVNNLTNALLKTNHTKFYLPVVTLSTEDDNIQQLKSGFKRTIK